MMLIGSSESLVKFPGRIQFLYTDFLFPEYLGVRNQAPSETPDLSGDVDSKPGTPLSESGGQIPSDIQFSYIDSPFPEDPGVCNQAPLDIPDPTSDADKKPGKPLSAHVNTHKVHYHL